MNPGNSSLSPNIMVTSSVALPAGEWSIPLIGAVTITVGGIIYIQGKIIDASSWVYETVKTYFVAKAYEKAKTDGTKTDNHSSTTARSLPTTGDEYSSKDQVKDGKVIQRRYYGKSGKPEVDIDYTNHGNAKLHPKVPHRHDWINGERSPDSY